MVAKGDIYKCNDCGLSFVIEEPCGCHAIDLICCGNRMRYSGRKKAVERKPSKKATK